MRAGLVFLTAFATACGPHRATENETARQGEPVVSAEPAPEPDRGPTETDPAAGPGTYRRLAASSWQTCGLRVDGTIHCWRSGATGLEPAASGRFVDLGEGHANRCGIREDGIVECPPEPDIPPGGQAAPLGVPGEGRLESLVGTRNFRCGLQADGRVRCRGQALLTPRPSDEVFTQIVAGNAFLCGLLRSGRARCFTADGPEVRLDGGPYRALAANDIMACGLRRRDGGLECSGPSLANDPGVVGLTSLALGLAHGCGLRADGAVVCWGMLGDHARPPEGEHATQVVVGQRTCILRTDGTVGCWGSDGADERVP